MASECQAKPAIHQVLDNSSEYDVFWLFITDEMIDLMVVETNRYADQVKEKKGGDATGSLFCALRTPSLSLGQAYRLVSTTIKSITSSVMNSQNTLYSEE